MEVCETGEIHCHLNFLPSREEADHLSQLVPTGISDFGRVLTQAYTTARPAAMISAVSTGYRPFGFLWSRNCPFFKVYQLTPFLTETSTKRGTVNTGA